MSHKVVWFQSDAPTPDECHMEDERGTITAAFELAAALSRKVGFLMGQILAPDGKVLANVAPDGVIKETK